MANSKIKDFFNGRYFDIPKYQRGYAWERKNVRELFDDIFESMQTNSNHYVGTIVLSRIQNDADRYYVVDGQQRISTITMIINAIVKHLPKKDIDYYHRFYIEEDGYRLKPLGKDKDFFLSLMRNGNGEPENKSQRLLKDAYEEIDTILHGVKDKKKLLTVIEKLEIMEFIEVSEGDAIRIFQTVNDRGKPLSNMEKAKSLLIYFSNRYLDKRLDDDINTHFGEMFEKYDQLKHLGEALEINLISNREFNEDTIMRYHFISYSDDNYDATAPYVLDYLKTKLANYRTNDKKHNYKNLENFIDVYVKGLHEYFRSLAEIINKANSDVKYYRYFNILGFSATLYPVIVKLNSLGILNKQIPSKEHAGQTILDLLQLIEVRVYKTRGTDPRAEISRFAYEVDKRWTLKDIQDWFQKYNERWMSKAEFQTALTGRSYGNVGLPHIFIEYCENIQNRDFTINELKEISQSVPTMEHILAQTPKFSAKAAGFKDNEEYIEYEHKIGNLTVLEKKLNSAVHNMNPSEKVSFYDRSQFKATKVLSSLLAKQKAFQKNDIEARTEILAAFCLDRWWC